ncbi:hypothetical protein GJ496_011421 [Pomphorhynchus laevis]|nr:hypothetical protein GJ496_011421 [Pomphorhynchus laevis]
MFRLRGIIGYPAICPTNVNAGALPTIRDNEIRNILATTLNDICSGVAVEPELQQVENRACVVLPTNRIDAGCEAENDIRGGNQKIRAADKRSAVQDGFQVHTSSWGRPPVTHEPLERFFEESQDEMQKSQKQGSIEDMVDKELSTFKEKLTDREDNEMIHLTTDVFLTAEELENVNESSIPKDLSIPSKKQQQEGLNQGYSEGSPLNMAKCVDDLTISHPSPNHLVLTEEFYSRNNGHYSDAESQHAPSKRIVSQSHSRPIGFPNIGNSCFLNAILRSLFCLDMFMIHVRTQHAFSEILNCIRKKRESTDNQPFGVTRFTVKAIRKRNRQYRTVTHPPTDIENRVVTFLGHMNCLADILEHANSKQGTVKRALRGILDLTPLEKLRQHDAHEMLLSIFDLLPGCDDLFSFTVCNTLRCTHCDAVTRSEDVSFDLCLGTRLGGAMKVKDANSIPQPRPEWKTDYPDECDLNACVQKRFGDEMVDGFMCIHCGKYGVKISRKINSLPSMLIISLLRFGIEPCPYSNVFDASTRDCSRDIVTSKLMTKVAIPEHLNMYDYCVQPSLPTEYILHAIVSHEGFCPKFGHYICDARLQVPCAQIPHGSKNNDPVIRWFTFNDDVVDRYKDFSKLLQDRQRSAYILFYQRSDKAANKNMCNCEKIYSERFKFNFTVNIQDETVSDVSICHIVTIHDMGTSHCQFHDFVNDPACEILRKRVIWIHVDLPGQEDNAPDLDMDTYPSLLNLACELINVIDSVSLKQVVIMGDGVGANIAVRFAMLHPERCHGLILIRPTSTTAGIMETVKDKLYNWKLNTKGMSSNIENYLLWYKFNESGHKLSQMNPNRRHSVSGPLLDSLNLYVIRQFQENLYKLRNAKNLGLLLNSFLRRESIADNMNLIKCDVLTMVGRNSSLWHTTDKFYSKFRYSRLYEHGDIVKGMENSPLISFDNVTDIILEVPEKLAHTIQFFLQGLGLISGAPLADRLAGLGHQHRSLSMAIADAPSPQFLMYRKTIL